MVLLPHNLRGIIAIAIVLGALMIWYIHINSKEKTAYESTTGRVTYLDKQYENLPVRNLGKYRYLTIEGYTYPFEIFVGKDPGDFKPKFEQVDKLKVGDIITVFYYETENTKTEGVNRYLQFIDKDKVSIFERGTSGKTAGIVMIGLCGLLIIVGIELYKRKKIPY